MAEAELPPLSEAKMAVGLAISLLDRAYCMGAVADDLRQTLLQQLRAIQADLDRAVGQLIEGTLDFNPNTCRVFSKDIWRYMGVVDEIDDAIDEIDYRRLEEEVGNPNSKLAIRKFINKVTRLDIPGSKLKRLRKAIYSFQYMVLADWDPRQLWSPLVTLLEGRTRVQSTAYERYSYPSWLATVRGVSAREREKEDLVQWLTKDDTAEGNPLTVCLLSVADGARTTVLANTVCEDLRVRAHFDFIVWVPVQTFHENLEMPYFLSSEKFSSFILETVTGEIYSDVSTLECSLREQLEDKKLLLILDTVQSYNWEPLLAPLEVCRKGSKILLMTCQFAMHGNIIPGAVAHVISSRLPTHVFEARLPSHVGSEDYREGAPVSPPRHNRYPSWISNNRGIFGRNRETEEIVQWLTMDTDQDNPFSVYALVGMAGMGKSTLANIVCQDPRVLDTFNEVVVWVPVSVNFDTGAMARFIFEKVTGKSPGYSSMGLMYSLTETLRYRKLLLILDDVWEDSNVDKWETLVAPLRVCKKGTKVLLTSRMQSVVDMAAVAVGSQVKYLRIDELKENDNLMLFKSRLPSQVGSEDYDTLMLIGGQIVKKIGGCPLITSLVASWLGLHMDTHRWNRVLQKGWQHLEEKCIVLLSLRLSYDCLPTELQTCFRYCSLFPKGYKFKKGELAKMWTGSGLIPFKSSKLENIGIHKTKYVDLLSAEDVGEEYFDVLARKSFFCCMLETETSDGNQQEYYVLHDLMHDLAQHISKDECARVDSGDFYGISITTRHLSIAPCCNLGAICRHLNRIYMNKDFTNLRTLIIQIEFGLDQETELVLRGLLKKSRRLHLLYLGVPSLFGALDCVHGLIHLRYLYLFSCHECHLQKVFQLYHLQVFKLEYLATKGANCSSIHSLRCLRSLHVPDNMSSKIHNIGRLTLLKELHGFDIVKNDGRRLNALGNLSGLCQLTLKNLQNVLDFEEAAGIKLKEKHHMKLLSLSWNKHLKEPMDQNGRIIHNLEPNKEIQLLHIHGYSGVELPIWIENSSLIHLVSLELEYCMKWKSLPSLKELTSLKHLKLENLFQLEYIGTVLRQQFETNEPENAWLPPFLSTLTVRWCPKLKKLPDIPCTLELLIVRHAHLAVLPAILQRYTGGGGSAPEKSQLGFLHIESCAQLTSLNTGLLGQQEQLHSLKTMVLRHCERLHHLPTRGFVELHHLNSLEIVACPILRYVKAEDHLLPVSLRNLDVDPCGDIDVKVLMSLQNLATLRSLTLFNYSNLEELPSVEVFRTLKNLNNVSVARCKNLLSLGGLGAVASLRLLSILCCDKLSSSYSTKDTCTFKLQKLTIDRQALLSVEPLRSLRHTSDLHISDDYAMESLPGQWFLQNASSLRSIEIGVADSLHSLPSEMEKLLFLQSLHIERAPLLQSLPQLPASLSTLTIWGCDPRFLECYEGHGCSDWSKIAHVANVDIQAIAEGMNYSDDDQNQGLLTSTVNPYGKYIVID